LIELDSLFGDRVLLIESNDFADVELAAPEAFSDLKHLFYADR
jgi:hypothetical protein